MKYYRLNQIAMAVLGALLLIFGTRTIIQIAFEEHKPEKAAHKEEKKETAGGEGELAALLAKGDAAKGETAAAACKACHSFDAGAPSPIGPNLHNVVGRKIASVEGFNYSPALKAKSGEDWTYENLSAWLHNPAEFAAGTTMAFPGIPDAAQRADVILFLKSKTENPPPLPEAGAAPAAAPEGAPAPAEEGAKPAGDKNAEVAALVGKADPAKGETAAAVCKACHSFDKDAPSPIGPNLYGVVGRKIASVEGFNYSPALKEKAGEVWDYAHIDAMITNPAQYAPGTMMAFPGIPDANQRAEVIAFLRTKADTPAPLPEGGAAPAEEKPAEAAPPAAEQAPAEAPPAAEEEQPAEEAPPTAEEPPAETPPAAEEQPAEPAPPAAEEAPAEPAPPAEEAPAEPTPPAAEEAPAEPMPPVEEPAEPAPPAAEEAPAETPAPAPEAPKEPAAEAPAQTFPEADMTSPSTETQPQPVVPGEPGEEPAPAPVEEPAAEEQPPAAEPTPAPAPVGSPEADMTSPSTETQPQPVAPEEPQQEQAPPPAEEPAPAAPSAAPSAGDDLSSQPQPVYPEGAPEAGSSAPAAPGAEPAPADLSSQPQPAYPEGEPQ
jgi:cytochrome c2